MPQLTIQQAAQFACSAGFPPSTIPTWVAVLEGESGLDTQAVNSSDPHGGSFGIAQINGVHFGQKFGANGQYVMSQQAAFDPMLAMQYSYQLSAGGNNFGAWGAFTNGSYQQHLAKVRQALSGWQCTPGSLSPDIANAPVCTVGIPTLCPPNQQCWPIGSSGLPLCSNLLSPPWAPARCFPNSYFDGTYACDGGNGIKTTAQGQANPLNLPDWIVHPDWVRVLKLVGGVLGIAIALIVSFWPEAQQAIQYVGKAAAKAGKTAAEAGEAAAVA